MKETISKQIKEFLTLDRYLTIVGSFLMVLGIVLFVYCIIFNISIIAIPTNSNPLFYLIFGMVVLCFRYFIIVTDKKEECE